MEFAACSYPRGMAPVVTTNSGAFGFKPEIGRMFQFGLVYSALNIKFSLLFKGSENVRRVGYENFNFAFRDPLYYRIPAPTWLATTTFSLNHIILFCRSFLITRFERTSDNTKASNCSKQALPTQFVFFFSSPPLFQFPSCLSTCPVSGSNQLSLVYVVFILPRLHYALHIFYINVA